MGGILASRSMAVISLPLVSMARRFIPQSFVLIPKHADAGLLRTLFHKLTCH